MRTWVAGGVAVLAVLVTGGGTASAGERDDSASGSESERRPSQRRCCIELVLVGGYLNIRSLAYSIRDVPNHPKDGFAVGTQSPIVTRNYEMSGMVQLGITSFGRFFDDRVHLGLSVLWMLPITDLAERNYTNAIGTSTRGYGAALTYATFSLQGVIPLDKVDERTNSPSLTPKVYMEVGRGDLMIGVSASYFSVIAETGWDRYDSLEVHQQRMLGRYIPVSLYLQAAYFQFGVEYPLEIYQTALGKQSALAKSLTYHIGMRF